MDLPSGKLLLERSAKFSLGFDSRHFDRAMASIANIHSQRIPLSKSELVIVSYWMWNTPFGTSIWIQSEFGRMWLVSDCEITDWTNHILPNHQKFWWAFELGLWRSYWSLGQNLDKSCVFIPVLGKSSGSQWFKTIPIISGWWLNPTPLKR